MNPPTDEASRSPRECITDAQLEALLRATGVRPAAPAERAERVRAAAHAVFRAQAAGVRRRRLTWGWSLAAAALLLAALALPILRGAGTAGGPALARIARVSGEASIRSRGLLFPRSVPARAGGPVRVRSEVATSAQGLLAFAMASGGSVRLAPGSRVHLLDARVVQLDRGALYVDSEGGSAAGADPIEIRTPLGRVLEKGTQFEVRLLDDSVRVRVRRGAVELRRGETGIDVGAGRELEIDSQGGAHSRDMAAFGSDWDWVSGIAPPMDIQGRTLREFLDWAALERGLKLQFADDSLAASAATIVLNGSIEGLDPDQALDSVLLTSRMSRRVAGDTLWIESLDPTGSRP